MATTNALTNYGENLLINNLLRGQSVTIPNVYLAIFTANPGEDGSQVSEVSGSGYARVDITGNGGFTSPIDGRVTTNQDIEFPTATGAWGTITHAGIMDAATGGNMLCYVQSDTPRDVLIGDAVRVRAGEMTFTIS